MILSGSQLRRLAAAALAVSALSLAGCGEEAPSTPTPSASASQPPAAAGGQYELVDDLCQHVDLAAISAVLPYVAEEPQITESPLENAMVCAGTLGTSENPDEHGVLSVYVEVFDDASLAEDYFDGFYDSNRALGATDLEGIGQRAYQFEVPMAAPTPTVRVLDGNAVISAEWYPLTTFDEEPPPLPEGIFEALIETLRATMTNLNNA
jgi:hypothetical protein